MELFHCAVDDKTPYYIIGTIYIYMMTMMARACNGRPKEQIFIFDRKKKIPGVVLYYYNVDGVIKTRSAIF